MASKYKSLKDVKSIQRRKRTTPDKLSRLVAVFNQTEAPSFDVREKLGHELGMTNREVQEGFSVLIYSNLFFSF